MIYTVTLNPSIDYTVELDKLTAGSLNRCREEYITFGGKGLNVSAILSELGIPTKALGFCAGSTGRLIAEQLSAAGIESDLVELSSGNSRINVKIKAQEETEINAKGPDISHEELEQFFEKLSQVTDGDTLVLAGSIPESVSDDIYEQILSRLSDKSIRTVVDAQGKLLANVLRFEPFLIKPNIFELESLFGESISSDEQVTELARSLRSAGARNVLVSMGQNGSLLVDSNYVVHRLGVCSGNVVSSVGAGDSMVAGFLAGCEKTDDYEFSLRLATACGGATAFSKGIAKKELIFDLFRQL